MFHTRWLKLIRPALVAVPLVLCAAGGCDDVPPDPEKNRPVTSQPAATSPSATQASTTQRPAAPAPQPVETFVSISQDGGPARMVAFPPAKLRLRKLGDGVQAVLYTDDPPAAASKDYRGNSYLFEMELPDAAEAADLPRVQFRYRADGSVAAERDVETTHGIFLNGWETHLQPLDAVVVFEGRPPQLLAKVAGRFRVVGGDRDGPPRVAMVQAVLPAIVETDVKRKD